MNYSPPLKLFQDFYYYYNNVTNYYRIMDADQLSTPGSGFGRRLWSKSLQACLHFGLDWEWICLQYPWQPASPEKASWERRRTCQERSLSLFCNLISKVTLFPIPLVRSKSVKPHPHSRRGGYKVPRDGDPSRVRFKNCPTQMKILQVKN